VVLTVTDSLGTFSNKSVSVDVLLVNDQSLNISIPVDMVTFVEDSGPLQIFPNATVIDDPDDDLDMRSVIFSASLILYGHNEGYEWLSFNVTTDDNISESFSDGVLRLMGSGTVDEYEEVNYNFILLILYIQFVIAFRHRLYVCTYRPSGISVVKQFIIIFCIIKLLINSNV